MLCGALVLYIIASFFRPTPSYNAFAAEPVFLLAGPLVLWQFLRGSRIGSLRHSPGTALLAALLLLGAVSTLLSENPEAAWSRLQLYYACALLGAGVFLAGRNNVTPVVVSFLLTIAAGHAWFLVELMSSIYAWEGRRVVLQGVATNYFAHIRHFGYLGFLAACGGTGVILLSERPYWRWIGFSLGVLAVYGLIQFGSRGAFLSWLVFAALLFAIVPAKRHFALSCVVTVSLASLAVQYVDTSHPFPNKQQQSVFTRQSVGWDHLESTRVRIDLWQASLLQIIKRPVLGHGPDGYVLSRCCPKGTVQPHNSLIQFMFEFGILGTGIALAALGVFLWRPLKLLRISLARAQPDITLGILVSLPASLLVFSMVDGLLYHAVPLLNFSIIMGLLGAAASWRRDDIFEVA
jgi:O-antigen ligase